jgi:hypothetical protein
MISNFAGRGIPQPFQQQTTALSVGLDWQQNAQVPTASPDVFDFEEVMQTSTNRHNYLHIHCRLDALHSFCACIK